MARLREQRNLINAIYNIRKGDNSITGNDKKIRIEAILGQPHQAEILTHALKSTILLEDKGIKFATNKDDAGFLDRCSKISTLIQSCLDDNFLIPTKNIEDHDMVCYKITSRGTDLLNPVGFLNIWFEKHSKIITFLWGSIVTGLILGMVWIITNFDRIKPIISFLSNKF